MFSRSSRIVLWLVCAALPAGGLSAAQQSFSVKCTQNTNLIQAFEVFELTFQHEGQYANPFFDVNIDVVFTSPAGKTYTVGGFHYGSLEKPRIEAAASPDGKGRKRITYHYARSDTWKARFAPDEEGTWKWSYTFTSAAGQRATGMGHFRCVRGRRPNPGFVRQDPSNPFRWVFDDGSPFHPIGLQECLGDGTGAGSPLAAMALEGPFRLDRPPRPDQPPGAMFKPGPSMNPQNGDVYFRRYSRCGFNIVRYSQQNCSYPLYRDLDHYLVHEAIMTDEYLRHVRKYGMRIMYGIFGYQQVFNDRPDDAAAMEKVKRFVKYSVDRWGAYTDIWEFLNEQHAADGWYAIMIPYIKSIDPYRHPVTTSWERPHLQGIDVNAPHWYVGMNDLGCDQQTAANAANWRKHGKPVIVGEHGNTSNRNPTSRPAGVGGVWDPTSAVRMRIRNWTAFFNEISFIFWATSYAKDGHFMNIWLGPREREYVRAMQDFAYALGGGLKMAKVDVAPHGLARAWALASDRRAGVYIHHFRDHITPVKNLTITLDVPRAATGWWYNTETAAIVRRIDLPAGRQTIDVPEFVIDIALLITPDGCPDIDKDGIPNDADDDNDNDGVKNDKDAFPLEPEERADADGDLIGDNLDADKNGDGIGDDDNNNGKPDHEEMDLDGDGVPRAGAVPWDAFPDDPKEWADTDGDGIGDNSDPDIDGDGFTNDEERKAGTDPYNKLSFPG